VAGYPWKDTKNDLWPADFHIVGKDIVKFHAIYWPAFLLAAGLPPPKTVIAHGHWTYGGEKMSKSKGNVVDPFEAITKYGADPLRYYLLRYGSFVDDGGLVTPPSLRFYFGLLESVLFFPPLQDYSDELVAQRKNADLANNFGNLVSRMTSAALNPQQHWPKPSLLTPEDAALVQLVSTLPGTNDTLYTRKRKRKKMGAISCCSHREGTL